MSNIATKGQLRLDKLLSRGLSVEPVSLTGLIDGPGPRHKPLRARTPGFGPGQGEQNLKRHPAFPGGLRRRLVARGGGPGQRKGGQDEIRQHKAAEDQTDAQQHGFGFSDSGGAVEASGRIFPNR